MITQEQSGLSQADYDALKAANVNPTYQFIVKKYSLDFSTEGPNDTFASSMRYAAHASGVGIFRARNGQIMKYNGTSWSQVSTYTYSAIVTPTFFEESGTLYFFYSDSGTLKKRSTTDGTTWSGDTSIGALPSDTYFLAASRSDRCHGACRRAADSYNTRFFCYEDTSLVWSEIYWAHMINGLGAAQIDDNEDTIIISTPLPQIIGTRSENSNAQTVAFQAGGIISFIYRNQNWSDHYVVESFDDTNIWLRRLYVTASKINDYIVAVAYGADGTAAAYQESVQIYRSKNGRYWEQATPFVTRKLRRGAYIGISGDYAYLIGLNSQFKAESTDFLGYTPSSAQSDISDYVDNFSLSFGQMMQGSFVAGNENNSLLDNTVLGQEVLHRLDVYLGYIVAGNPIQSKVASLELDAEDLNNTISESNLSVSFRDYLSRMTDRVKAHQVIERDTAVIGPDDFEDLTESGYGGLRHTATQRGSWRTGGNVLAIASSNKESIAFNTYDVNSWNGSLQVGFMLPSGTDPQIPDLIEKYAGIIFRAYDASNFWAVRYRNDNIAQRWEIIQVTGGRIGLGPTITEALAYDTWHYMKVITRYQKVQVYKSVDGVDWTLLQFGGNDEYIINSLIQGTLDDGLSPDPVRPMMVEKGFWGYIGRAYSNLDTWDIADPEPITLPPIIEPAPYVPALPPGTDFGDYDWDSVDPGDGPTSPSPTVGYGTVYALEGNSLIRCSNFGAATPTWEIVVEPADLTNVSELKDFVFDPVSPLLNGVGDELYIALLTDTGLWYSDDAQAASPTWSLKRLLLTPHDLIRATKDPGVFVCYAQNGSGLQEYMVAIGTKLWISSELGNTSPAWLEDFDPGTGYFVYDFRAAPRASSSAPLRACVVTHNSGVTTGRIYYNDDVLGSGTWTLKQSVSGNIETVKHIPGETNGWAIKLSSGTNKELWHTTDNWGTYNVITMGSPPLGDLRFDVDHFGLGIFVCAKGGEVRYTTSYTDASGTSLTGITANGSSFIKLVHIPYRKLLTQELNDNPNAFMVIIGSESAVGGETIWAVTFNSSTGAIVNEVDITPIIASVTYTTPNRFSLTTAPGNTQVILLNAAVAGSSTPSKLILSEDGGGTWEIVQNSDVGNPTWLEDSSDIVLLGNNSAVYYSSDRGRTVFNQTGDLSGTVIRATLIPD